MTLFLVASLAMATPIPYWQEKPFVGFTHRECRFASLGEIVSDTEASPTETGHWRVSAVTPEVTSLSTWHFGLSSNVGPQVFDDTPFSALFLAQVPNGGESHMSVPSAHAFTPMRYRSSDGDFKASLGLRKSFFGKRLVWTVGHHLIFSAAAVSNASLGQNPTGRMELATGPTGSWMSGLEFLLENWHFSGAYDARRQVQLTQTVDARIPVTPGLAVGEVITLSATTHWAPESLMAAALHQIWPGIWVGASLRWENWRPYEPPFLVVQSGNDRSKSDPIETKNTLNPGLSVKMETGRHNAHLRYLFQPSPLLDSSLSGNTNLIDTSIHSVTLDYSHEVTSRLHVGLHFRIDTLTERKVTKVRSDVPGSPGYTISGSVLSLGTSVSLDL